MGMCTNESVCRNVFVSDAWISLVYLLVSVIPAESVYSLNGEWLCWSSRDRESNCSRRATLGTIVTCQGLEHRTRTQRQLKYFQHGDITTMATLKQSYTDKKGSSPLPQQRQKSPVVCHSVTHNAETMLRNSFWPQALTVLNNYTIHFSTNATILLLDYSTIITEKHHILFN